jgi:hypothetical protein
MPALRNRLIARYGDTVRSVLRSIHGFSGMEKSGSGRCGQVFICATVFARSITHEAAQAESIGQIQALTRICGHGL